MQVRRRFLVSVALVFLGQSQAAATDFQTPPPATFFGNLHSSQSEAYFEQQGVSSPSWPEFNGSGGAMDRVLIGKPGLNLESMTFLHGSFDVNNNLKLGVFATYQPSDKLLAAIDTGGEGDARSGLSSITNENAKGSLGVEALYHFRPRTWLEGRVGLRNRPLGTLSFSNSPTVVSKAGAAGLGLQLGLGGHLGVSDNLSLNGDVSFLANETGNGGYDNSFAAVLTGQYDFVDTALAAYTQLEYQKYFSSFAPATDGYAIRTGLKWSLGNPSSTLRRW